MKTRNGFVSNSSSSSFVLITSKDSHDKALKKLSPEAREFVEEVVAFKTFAGITIACMSWTESNESLCAEGWKDADHPHTHHYIDYYDEENNEMEGEDAHNYWTGLLGQYWKLVGKDSISSQEDR